jgi:hypothetical protein
MGFAISAIIAIIFILPGISFRRFYYTEEFSKQFFRSNFTETFFSSVLPAIAFHVFFGWIASRSIIDSTINVTYIAKLIAVPENVNFELIQRDISKVLLYNLSINLFAAFFGYFIRKVIRRFKLDRKQKFFRFRNNWHYLFSGEHYDFKRSPTNINPYSPEDISIRLVTVLIQVSDEKSILYRGFLTDYELSEKHGLETITLRRVYRRNFVDDNESTIEQGQVSGHVRNNYYEIDGSVLTIPYNKIININIAYYYIDNNLQPVLIN